MYDLQKKNHKTVKCDGKIELKPTNKYVYPE